MKSILGYIQGSPFRIDTEFTDAQGKPYKDTIMMKGKKDVQEEVPVYANRDTVKGQVKITPLTTKKLEHMGIKAQLLGQIDVASERGVKHEFMSMARGLAGSGELSSPITLPFEFPNVEMQYDSYKGQQVRCRYFLRVNIAGKGITPDTKHDSTIWVRNFEQPTEAAAPIKMEVGIEDCLHIEFEYDRARYHLKDVVVGKIYFLLVRIKLKHMEVEIRRKETVGGGSNTHSELETLAKYEIMDGAPVRGESVPIRLYLSPYDLSPTYKDVHNKYSVRYFLNLVLVDEEDRRYFKQQEITLYRKQPDTPEEAAAAAAAGPPKLAHSPQMLYGSPTPSGAPSSSGGGSSSSANAGVAISKDAPPRPIHTTPYHGAALAGANAAAAAASAAAAGGLSAGSTGAVPAAARPGDAGQQQQGALDVGVGAGAGGGGVQQANGSAMDGPLSTQQQQQQSPQPSPSASQPAFPPPLQQPQQQPQEQPPSNPLEQGASVSSPSPPPSYEQQVHLPELAPPAAPPPHTSGSSHSAGAAAAAGAAAGAAGPPPPPYPPPTGAVQQQQQPAGAGPGTSQESGTIQGAGDSAASPAAPERDALEAAGAGTAGVPPPAAQPADPMFGGGGGDVGDDLEPLSFGNLEDGKED